MTEGDKAIAPRHCLLHGQVERRKHSLRHPIVTAAQELQQLLFCQPETSTGDETQDAAHEARADRIISKIEIPTLQNSIEQSGQVRRGKVFLRLPLQQLMLA